MFIYLFTITTKLLTWIFYELISVTPLLKRCKTKIKVDLLLVIIYSWLDVKGRLLVIFSAICLSGFSCEKDRFISLQWQAPWRVLWHCGIHLKVQPSKYGRTCWLLFRTGAKHVNLWVLQEWLHTWVSPQVTRFQQTIDLEHQSENCFGHSPGHCVSGCIFFILVASFICFWLVCLWVTQKGIVLPFLNYSLLISRLWTWDL